MRFEKGPKMKRRMRWVISIVLLLLLAAGVARYFVDRANREREAARIALGEAMTAMRGSIALDLSEPKLRWDARLDGDTTVRQFR